MKIAAYELVGYKRMNIILLDSETNLYSVHLISEMSDLREKLVKSKDVQIVKDATDWCHRQNFHNQLIQGA